jgi:glycosyltransferase involved in cell wall biosynthesis
LTGSQFAFTLFSIKEGPLALEAKQQGIPVRVIGKKRTADPRFVLKIAEQLRSEGIDLVHTHSANSNAYGILASFLCPQCRPIVTAHTYYKDVYGDYIRSRALIVIGYRLDLFLSNRACRLIAVSQSVKDRIVADGMRSDKITVIPNGISVEGYRTSADRESVRKEFGIAQSDILVGTAGRLALVKNQAMILEAAARITPKVENLRLVFCGEGPEEENLKRLARDLGIGSRVIFAGLRSDMARVLSGLDFFVLSSRSEVAPMVLLESMALEIPVISTDVGGVSEMMEPGKSGLLTENDNVEEMAEAILGLAVDPGYRKDIGRRGREFVEREFGEASMLQATSDLYVSAFRELRRTA